MTAKRDFVIPKLSLVLNGTLSTYAIDDEAVRFRCLLEPLLPAPYMATNSGDFLGKRARKLTSHTVLWLMSKNTVSLNDSRCLF